MPEPVRAAEPVRTVAPPPPPPPANKAAEKPPPSYADIPVIKLAEMDEPPPEDEEEGGGPLGRVREGIDTAWAWVKSLTVTAVLVVVIVLLVQNYKAWFPQAMEATMRLFTRMDELKARIAPPQASREAMDAAVEKLPQLTTATIEAIILRSGQPMAPAEVFRRASEATARGRASLAPTAARELASHMDAVTAALTEAEAARLRAYLQKLGAGEATLPYEDDEAMWLTARGARRLPAQRLSRLQDLSAQAITAGLGPKPAPEAPSLPSLPPLPSLPAFKEPSR
jgi:hypothetical protein